MDLGYIKSDFNFVKNELKHHDRGNEKIPIFEEASTEIISRAIEISEDSLGTTVIKCTHSCLNTHDAWHKIHNDAANLALKPTRIMRAAYLVRYALKVITLAMPSNADWRINYNYPTHGVGAKPYQHASLPSRFVEGLGKLESNLQFTLDVVGDSLLAIESYHKGNYLSDLGLKYVYTYGVLQALFLLQDAVRHLSEAFAITYQPIHRNSFRHSQYEKCSHWASHKAGSQGAAVLQLHF